jgi:hypothetical protein
MERFVSDPRLNRLATLWHGSLEAGLSPAEEAELQSLLADEGLAEAWMEQQGGLEAEPTAAVGPVPAGLRSVFQRQFQPWTYWGRRLAVAGLLVAGVWLAWPKSETLNVQEAAVDEVPYRVAQPSRPSQPKPQCQELGPPPGLDRHQHLWTTRSGGSYRFDVMLDQSAHLQASIVDAQGRPIENLDFGQHPQGPAHLSWDGRLADGRRAPAGRYQVQIRRDGVFVEDSQVLIEKN